ncbi:flavin reductase [Hylemonella gracilis]|jgi:flavin reductase (DIM6/NTAB) family NADH-FMN oxidoreductase RutF|uniref:Flavin reductase n=1 Tax=Hylemonella gracilis TaxID=80880 RepID=A0A4P6UGD0_9BURK|nr:flavin reductase family protein [Hylemonella gracilis]QBK04288.1 flavin reductase [Hylemonella gracilis]
MRAAVDLAQSYRLLNHGPTVLVSAAHGGQRNIMAAAWNMALDFAPPKIAVVLDKSTYTRELVEASGHFCINVPCRAQAGVVLALGQLSGRELQADAEGGDKFARFGLNTFAASHGEAPLLQGCVAWLECRLMPEPRNQQLYDLFIGEVAAAWADTRVFADGHWRYDDRSDPALRTLHYVAGGHFFAIGEAFEAQAARPQR